MAGDNPNSNKLINGDGQNQFSFTVWFLSCVFGIGSWVAMNGLWVELPNLINQVPEGWKISSYLVVIIQLANIGPIVYGVLKKKLFKHHTEMFQHVTIYILLVIGFLGCICLGLLWKHTTFIFNENRSTALMFFTFLIALVDCTSSVTFLPYMSVLPAIYIAPLFIGENLGSLIPAIVALGQGVEEYRYILNTTTHEPTGEKVLISNVRFSQGIFFILLGVLMIMCLSSYILLNVLKSVKRIHVNNMDINYISNSNSRFLDSIVESNCSEYYGDSSEENQPLVMRFEVGIGSYSVRYIKMLLLLLMWLSFLMNGVTSSIGSFAYAPYGDLANHLAATLGAIASALSCLLFYFCPSKSKRSIITGIFAYTVTVVYLTTMALKSPTPLLYQDISGKIIIVFVSILSSCFASYTQLAIASVMRDCGHKFLFYAGVSIQIGSFIGGVIMFFIVNFTHLFEQT